jgi:cytoplasmic iron level regulating protein YaaA (DUF328/UPF0246 family)
MKILISPAKSIQTDVNFPKVNFSEAKFISESEKLIQKLKKYSVDSLMELFNVSKDIAEINHLRFKNWESPIEEKNNIIPAVYAFTGEVYRGLDVKTIDASKHSYLNENLRILSGLYGILKPFDLLYPYRLEMGTKFKIDSKTSNLYQFWGDKLSDFLNEEEQGFILNLASNEYFKAINSKKIKGCIITPVFKEFRNGEYKIVMTYAKHARGLMTRYCITNEIQNPEEIKKFDLENYQYMENLSHENEWVFLR